MTLDLYLLPERDRLLLVGYLTAKEFVVRAGFASDIDWAENLRFVQLTPGYVMRETAWVIVNSGFRFQVARKLWPALEDAFNGFDPERIDERCRPGALRVLNYPRKIDAIIQMACLVRDCFDIIVEHRADVDYLRSLPFIGPVTCYHLAKLLGADVVKPDVHLVRASTAAEMEPQALCNLLGSLTGDRATTVDSVLWRWAEQKQAKLEDWMLLFSSATKQELS